MKFGFEKNVIIFDETNNKINHKTIREIMKNIATNKGDSAKKVHLEKTQLLFSKDKNVWYTKMSGIGTECKSNSINKESFSQFHWAYKYYPEMCCKKCISSYLEMMKMGKKITNCNN